MKKKINSIEYIKKTRNFWSINPITRIKKNGMKDKKKRRALDKKLIKDGYNNDNK